MEVKLNQLQSYLDAGYTHFAFSLKMSAWLGKSNIYTSDMNDAKPFKQDEVVKFCKKHYDNQSGIGCVPISIESLIAVIK